MENGHADVARTERVSDDENSVNAGQYAGGRRGGAAEIIAAFDSANVDFSDSERAWRYGAGRNLSGLEADARRITPS